jgi:hypothetical protein
MVKRGVLFEVRIDFLNYTEMSFGFKGLKLTTAIHLVPRLRTCGAVPSLRLRVSGLQLRYRDSFTCNPLPFIHTASLLQSAETDVIALLYSEQQEDRSDRITACGRWSCLPQMGSLQLYLPSAAYVA